MTLAEHCERLSTMLDECTSEVYALQAENVELRDENARLRSCLSDDAENAQLILRENARLRELVRKLYDYAYDEYPDGIELNFADQLRELGVEVDG